MTPLVEMTAGVPVATSSSRGRVPLETIVRTEELSRRPSRAPDYAGENKALLALSTALADSPLTILQTLADRVLEVLQADSAGLSLLTKDGERFYWAAISGAWRPHIGGGTPRDFGPCGDVLDHDAPMLFTHWELRYPYLGEATPFADEGLLVPFYVEGRAVGTIWAILHSDRRQFDGEDLRLLQSLGQFASAAYQAVQANEELKKEVAARKEAEREVRQWADRLEAKIRCLVDANRVAVIGQLSASIVHEVNQPLTGIVTNATTSLQLLVADPPNVDGASEIIRRTVRDAKRASEVIKRLHALFARKDSPTELLDLNDATREVIALSLPDLQRSLVTLRSEFASDLPPVMGDRVQLQQVVLNLVRNAAEAMNALDDRPRQLRVSTARTDSNSVLLEVQDSGSGIDPADFERVFEAFYTTKSGGMGMGLPICRAIIEAHGGKLWADQGLPHGAVFRFTLPLGVAGVTNPRELN
jgi:signal transduction histidine kinase